MRIKDRLKITVAWRRGTGAVSLLLLLALFAGLAWAAGSVGVDSSVIGGGGGRVQAGGSVLNGTIGQPLTGRVSAGGLALCSGFWCSAASANYELFLPLMLREAE